MNNIYCYFLLISLFVNSQKIEFPIDTLVRTVHETTINGKKINYQAEVGMQPVWDEDGLPIASLFYTYYTRLNNISKNDLKKRPLIVSFNGGPGSGSLWMHIGYTGPKILKIDKEGFPIQPYGVKENPFSIIDVADIVFVNPVNTGFSRMIKNKDGKYPDREKFFGINADIKYLGSWINSFVSRKNRWESPKYLIGESYGGTRVMGLSYELQNKHWMYLNGVIMVSPADYKLFKDGSAINSALNLPYFTATAWYHRTLTKNLQDRELSELLKDAEYFTINELMPAIAKGGFISEKEKEDIALKYSNFTSLDKKFILNNNLDVPNNFFWKELLKNKGGFTIGRLDSRYRGIDKRIAGSSPDSNIE